MDCSVTKVEDVQNHISYLFPYCATFNIWLQQSYTCLNRCSGVSKAVFPRLLLSVMSVQKALWELS